MSAKRDKAEPTRPVLRTLVPGEEIPPFPPRRYPALSGYIRLRWRIGTGYEVEAYEHRVVMERHIGRPLRRDEEVHHRNHDRSDNRIENLELLTGAEHHALHVEERRKHDVATMVELYRSGLSTPQVGVRIGADPSVVYRALVAAGEPMRSAAEAQRLPLDEERIRRLHADGVRARAIARELGVSSGCIDKRMREMGLAPFKTGRPAR